MTAGQGHRRLTDPADFEDFYQETHLAVFRYIYGLHGGPREEIEDLAAETYLKAWKARKSFQGEAQAALAWILRIARNLVFDSYRRQRSRPDPQEIKNTIANPDSQHPESVVLAEEQSEALLKALRRLTPQQRELIALRYLLGWRVTDIAEYLEIPENTASVRIRRILKTLRENWPSR